jgi:hypothetical protein
MRFNVNQDNVDTERIIIVVRSVDALAIEMPTPLNNATYAATQTGHFGSKTSVALGIIQPVISPARNQPVARRGFLL